MTAQMIERITKDYYSHFVELIFQAQNVERISYVQQSAMKSSGGLDVNMRYIFL